jgi:VWFA-related protein
MPRAAALSVFMLCGVAVAGTSPLHGHAQGATPPQNSPTFRAGVNIVELDVSVLDKQRRPVTGLTAADFTVLDNGQPRPVVAFSAVELPKAKPPAATWMRETSPDVTSNQFNARRLVVVAISDLIDASNVRDPDTMQHLAHAVIDQLGPADLASVVYLYQRGLGQDFTADRAKLGDAIDRLQPFLRIISGGRMMITPTGVPVPPVPTFALDPLTHLFDSLAALPDRRKVVFFIGDDHLVGELQERDQLYRAAERANVNIYCLALGLDPRNTGTFCKEMAANTGGEAVVDTNDPASEVPGLLRENQSYYLLGFEPANPAREGTARRVDVKVDRSDVEVRTRRGYEVSAPDAAAPARTLSAAAPTLFASPLPASGVPMQVAVIPVAGATPATPTVIIALAVNEPGVAWSRADILQVDVRAFAADGREEHGGRETVRWAPRPTRTGDREGTVFAKVDLPPGHHELRAAVRSVALNQTASVFADVEVPDFAKAPLSLSGVVLHAEADEISVGTETLTGLVSTVPTTRREFAVSDHVTASLVIYQGAKGPLLPVTLSTQIVNDHDAVVNTTAETIAVDRFSSAGRRAEWSFVLPLDRLPPGAYLLTFEATMGKVSDRRDVQFTVR